jgi:hypothetical protein
MKKIIKKAPWNEGTFIITLDNQKTIIVSIKHNSFIANQTLCRLNFISVVIYFFAAIHTRQTNKQ